MINYPAYETVALLVKNWDTNRQEVHLRQFSEDLRSQHDKVQISIDEMKAKMHPVAILIDSTLSEMIVEQKQVKELIAEAEVKLRALAIQEMGR